MKDEQKTQGKKRSAAPQDVEYMRYHIINVVTSTRDETLIKMLYARTRNLEKLILDRGS